MDFHTLHGLEEEEELVLGVRGARAGCEVRPCRKEVMAVRSDSSRNLEWKVRSQLAKRGDVALCDGGRGEADKAGVKGSTEGEVVGGICLIENVVGSGGRCDGVGRRIGKL